ncbi:MAG: hypothetical protein Fur0037_17600 [Planctomycetota bacterium]
MPNMRSPRPAAALAVLLCLCLEGCGAGLITGAVASSRGNSPAPQPAPGLSLPETVFPLVPGVEEASRTRRVLVSAARVSGRIDVRLRALGVTVDQGNPVIVSSQGTTTVIGFQLVTAPIVAEVGDPSIADLPAELSVLADGAEVAPAVAVLLARQPRAALAMPSNEPRLFLSPLGGTRARLRIEGLRATRAEDLSMLVVVADPQDPGATVRRPCLGLSLEPGQGGAALVSADVPGNDYPGPARLAVDDAIAGRSTEVSDAFYGPDIALALPRQGPTTGGSLVTLIGAALVPLDFTVAPAVPDFSKVELLFRKGGRELRLPAQDLRTAVSGLDRLVFTMPSSPDGRPGRVDIVLRLAGSVSTEVVAADVFLFANPNPVFGPRGAVLDRRPQAIAPLSLESRSGGATDLAVLTVEGGVGFLQMLLSEENGMFIRGAAPRRLGDPENPAERDPADICSGDFDGDSVPDLFVLNRGSGSAVHHVVLGKAAPSPPLGASFSLAGEAGNAQCRAADLDCDGTDDLLLLPGAGAALGALPQVYLSRSMPGAPAFVRAADLPVTPATWDAVAVGWIDGDAAADVVLLSGGTSPSIEIVFGNGDGTFGGRQRLSLSIPGQDPTPGVGAVGVHLCGPAFPRAIAAVLAGQPGSQTTPNAVAVLHADPNGVFQQPSAADTLLFQGEPFLANLSADVDSDPEVELMVASGGDQNQTFLLLEWAGGGFTIVDNGVESGSETMLSIGSLDFGTAFPTGPVSGVFAVHDSDTDGFRESRVSTLLVGSRVLLAPDLGAHLGLAPRKVLGGIFSPVSVANGGSTKDLAYASRDLVSTGTNDGFGGFFAVGPFILAPGLVPESLALARVTPRFQGKDALAYFTADGRLWVWEPAPGPGQAPRASGDLRPLAADPMLHGLSPSPRSRIRCADIDGDGVLDLVGLMVFDTAPSPREGDGLLLLLRGKAAPGPAEFPFYEPAVAEPVHGDASSLAVADFAPGGSPARLEVALSVPRGTGTGDGDHIRFYRYEPGPSPEQDRFVRSYSRGGPTVLLAGSAPTRIGATDFDGNGTIDLVVASQDDAALHLMLNDGTPADPPSEVEVGAFHESLASPSPASPGLPTYLRIGDINGDGNEDVLLADESISSGARSTAVAFYLSSGTGELGTPHFVSPTRIGNHDARLSLDLADINGDRVLDLSVSWDSSGPGERNVRVLFGGSR